MVRYGGRLCDLAGSVSRAQLDHQIEARPTMTDEVLRIVAFFFLGRERDRLDDGAVILDDAGFLRQVSAREHELKFLDAVVVTDLVLELGTVAVAQLRRFDESYGRRRVVDNGEGEIRPLAPEVHGDTQRLLHLHL